MKTAVLTQRLLAELLGSAFLLMIVVGSGIMAERLAQGNAALALLANALATGAGLFVLIMLFAPISGAHFNPLVTLQAWRTEMNWQQALCYLSVQCGGAILGVALAHGMFDVPFPLWSTKIRTGWSQWLAEGIASFGLILTLLRLRTASLPLIAACVALYITAAYWFTASTSFANPAVTLARSFTNTFAGIQPADVLPFILAQLSGLVLASLTDRLLGPVSTPPATQTSHSTHDS